MQVEEPMQVYWNDLLDVLMINDLIDWCIKKDIHEHT